MFDMDDATRILKVCILAFAAVTVGLGYVLSASVEADTKMRVKTSCQEVRRGATEVTATVTVTRGNKSQQFKCEELK